MPPVPGVTIDEARLADVCARYGIARLRVFGSVARGTASPDSDVDVLYELKPGRRLGWEIERRDTGLATLCAYDQGAFRSLLAALPTRTTVEGDALLAGADLPAVEDCTFRTL